MRAKFINEKFIEKSDPIKDMGIGQPKWEVVFYEYGDDEVVVNKKFYTRKEAQNYVDDYEYQYDDEVYDENGNETYKTCYKWYNSEDNESYFGYDIKMI